MLNLCVFVSFQLHTAYHDEDLYVQSQSQDTEPMPSPPKTASYTNLFDTTQDVPLGGSAHSMRNHLASVDERSSPTGQRNTAAARTIYGNNRPSPGIARRQPPQGKGIDKRAPMATCEDFSPTSPTTAGYKPPPSITGASAVRSVAGANNMDKSMSLASDAKYPTTQALITDTLGPSPPRIVPGSVGGAGTATDTTKRSPYSSTSSLNRHLRNQGTRTSPAGQSASLATQQQQQQPLPHRTVPGGPGSMPPPASTTRHIPMSKKSSGGSSIGGPAGPTYRSSTMGPSSRDIQRQARPKGESGYSSSNSAVSRRPDITRSHPEMRAAGISAAPMDIDIDNVPGAVRRPMSFVRALEMSDQLAVQEHQKQQTHHRQKRQTSPIEEDRQNLYGSSYEISV